MLWLKERLSNNKVVLFGNYTLLFFLLLHFFIVPFFPIEWHGLMFSILLTLIYLNLVIFMVGFRKTLLYFVMALIILDAVFELLELTFLAQISYGLNIVLFIAVVFKFIVVISKSKTMDIEVIMGAIIGYFLLGILSTMMINLVMSLNAEAYAFNESGILKEGVSRTSEFQYFALVTMSTLGYGEITPITPSARSVATFIAVTGQLYVAIIVALIVGKFSGQATK